MTSIRFTLPAGYDLCTWHHGFGFTDGRRMYIANAKTGAPTAHAAHRADSVETSPFVTPGAAVRGIITHAGLIGEAADVLLREVAALPEKFR